MSASLHGQTRTAPIILPALGNGQSLASLQANYALSEADFLRLQSPQSKTGLFAGWILSGWLGYVISVLPKMTVTNGLPDYSNITRAEGITVVAILIAGSSLYLIGLMLPNEKKTVTRKIKKYFADYQAGQQQGRNS